MCVPQAHSMRVLSEEHEQLIPQVLLALVLSARGCVSPISSHRLQFLHHPAPSS
jgi:hypothetical protein